ncbi:hypothetical protein Q0Z83_053910 [Actinoplanes sichuanensis]|uniref:Uncharacterized protein n=1 Tax=Actinoplanes sichuanensis TaxID=512349 RepID=A0ABW4ATA3_9ACTN|nr:hypothetical protein [Actinoplanes sichuanensis]BEL07200.1 hypothetical protein Q0Z83_053910 [Actinoplanes sichuanensis]
MTEAQDKGLLSYDAKPVTIVPVSYESGVLEPIDMGWCEYRFGGATGSRLARIIAHCDGERTVRDIATAVSAPAEAVLRSLTALYERGVVADAGFAPVPAQLYQEHAVAYGRTLRTRMSEKADLLGGELNRRMLLGSLVETYHFVSSAPYHIGAAVAHAADASVRDALAELFSSEARHGRDLEVGLLAAGMTPDEIARSLPLPGTQNVMNFLYALASTDLLSYAVCASVNESPKTDTAIKEGWDELIALDLLPRAALEPFRGHELEDEESDHASIAHDIFGDRATLSPTEQRRIRAKVESFTAVQHGCYQEMKEFYGTHDGPAAWNL